MSRFFIALIMLAPAGAWVAAEHLGMRLQIDSLFRASVFLFIAPLLEEWLFRHGLQDWLERKLGGRIVPNLLASAGFCLLHVQSGMLNAVWWMVPSLALGELWHRERKLALNALCHAWFNCSLWLVTVCIY